MKKRHITKTAVLLVLSMSLAGCASQGLSVSEKIELLEPVGFEETYECVAYRDIFVSEVYTGVVEPVIKEYSFSGQVNGLTYTKLPGDTAETGEVIAYTDSEKITGRIGEIETALSELKEMPELYELDSAHYKKELDKLYEELETTKIRAEFPGRVCAIIMGNGRPKTGNAVIAVSDETKKIMETDRISAGALADIKEIYALIKGEKYNVSGPFSSDSGMSSIFEIVDPEGKVLTGDPVSLVIVRNMAEHVLSVSSSLLREDSQGTYVYISSRGSSEKKYVTTGVTDDTFTEILSGLNENDRLVSSSAPETGSRRETVIRKDVTETSETRGYFVYPETKEQMVSLPYGTVIFDSFTVSEYEYVNEGDVIAKIHVEGDSLELTELELKLKRLTERNAPEAERERLSNKIEEIKKCYETTDIIAEASGIITSLAEFSKGDTVNKNSVIISTANAENCYIAVQDNDAFPFGCEVNITCKASGVDISTVGTVVSLGKNTEDTALKSDFRLISTDRDTVRKMLEIQGEYGNRMVITITREIKTFKDILAVPNSFVTVYGGAYKVRKVNGDGSVTECTFVSIGRDKDYYYCLYGLNEGDVLCSK